MSLRAQVIWIGSILLLMALLAFPSFFTEERRRSSVLIPDQGISLGLDLQGGVHWLLKIPQDLLVEREVTLLADRIRDASEEESLGITESTVVDKAKLRICSSSPNALATYLEDFTDVEIEGPQNGCFEGTLTSRYVAELMRRGQEQSIEVLQKRLDGTGVKEPTIAPQGEDRILVQMPGIDDPALVSDVLTQTTFLEFKRVITGAPNEELLRAQAAAQINEETEIVVELNDAGEVTEALLVDKKPVLTGAMLEDARVGFDQGNRPTVDFVWNAEGTKIFREFSRQNIGNRMAAVIDQSKGMERSRYVVTAPVIKAEIGKRGMIEGRFKPEEASKLALQLRSGALPIPLVVEEQRAVGPALGADSVRAGVRSVLAGGLLVLIFMAVYYQSSGLVANIALVMNLVIILGLMSFAQATLSLPGIAGLVLTVGMAVDANVIIFERIREELRSGKSMRNAVQIGFTRSRWAIIDANITGFIAAVALLYYGRGPVQGFAVTFTIGIFASVFCALVVSRVLIDVVLARWPQALKV